MKKLSENLIFPEKRVFPEVKPVITDLKKGEHIFLMYARFLGFEDKRAKQLLKGQKAYKTVDDFLEALAKREINAEVEMDAVLMTL